jgi:very-short-patch-repair endonuclease
MPITKVCLRCQRPFQVKPSRANRNNHCSRECRDAKPPIEILRNQYWVEKKSSYELARVYGVTSSTILAWLEQYGIERRQRSHHKPLTSLPVRPCDYCGQAFQLKFRSKNPHRNRFCSRQCANAAIGPHRGKPTLNRQRKHGVCQYCDSIFVIKYPHDPNRYCSKICSRAANAKNGASNPKWKAKVTLTCQQCDKTFEECPAYTEETRYCSKACQTAFLKTLTGDKRYNFKGGPKPMACEVCGTIKIVLYSIQKRFRACSRACAAELGRRLWPRISSIERLMAQAFAELGLTPVPQYPIDRVSVDFAFPEAKLAVECDGSYWHNLPGKHASDNRKNWFLRNLGWHVIRLTEPDIKANALACAAQVMKYLDTHPMTTLPPAMG